MNTENKIPSVPNDLLRKRFSKKSTVAGYTKSFPLEDIRQTQTTITSEQLRVCLLALDMSTKELGALFKVNNQVVRNWINGRTVIPKGISDYLRLKVSMRIRALSISTGTPVSLEEDLPSRIPSVRSLSAIDTILQNLKAYLTYERKDNE
tara:strand:- start:299 stop:748 length:450 start_codon:yes stop_codon:yes gene_type:complete